MHREAYEYAIKVLLKSNKHLTHKRVIQALKLVIVLGSVQKSKAPQKKIK